MKTKNELTEKMKKNAIAYTSAVFAGMEVPLAYVNVTNNISDEQAVMESNSYNNETVSKDKIGKDAYKP